MYACVCRGITEAEVREAGSRGVVAPEALIRSLGLDDDGCCGRCSENIQEFVELAWEGAVAAGRLPGAGPRPADAARANLSR